MKNILHYIKRLINIKTSIVYTVNTPIEKEASRYEFCQIRLNNVERVAEIRNKSMAKTFVDFIKAGERGYYAIRSNCCVAHGWIITNSTPKSKLVCDYFVLPPKSTFIHYCYVNEKQRGKGIYRQLLTYLYSSISKDLDIYIDTDIANIAAQKAIQRSGAKYIYRLSVLRIAGKKIIQFKRK